MEMFRQPSGHGIHKKESRKLQITVFSALLGIVSSMEAVVQLYRSMTAT